MEDFDTQKRKAFLNYLENPEVGLDFDLFAQDINKWAWLEEFIPGIIITSAGGSLPFQAEGTILGYPFYYRSEQYSASIKVGSLHGDKPYLPESAIYSARIKNDHYLGGETFVQDLIRLIPLLDKAPFLYRFPCKEIKWAEGFTSFEVLDEETTVAGWGQNPTEAFEWAKKPDEWAKTISETLYNMMPFAFEAREVSKIPVNQDTRVFPNVRPDFRVNF